MLASEIPAAHPYDPQVLSPTAYHSTGSHSPESESLLPQAQPPSVHLNDYHNAGSLVVARVGVGGTSFLKLWTPRVPATAEKT